MSVLAELRGALETVAADCAANARDIADGTLLLGDREDAKTEADAALAAKNWTQASLAAIQAYKTLGSTSDRGLR
jgi:hypothetical protein